MKKQHQLLTLTLAIITGVVFSCRKALITSEEQQSSSPVLPETPYNYANSDNDAKATLGRVLFYDKNLSRNNSVSCASCHQQEKAFCDNLKFSVGLEDVRTARNSPSIFSKSGRMFWDGRAASLNDLVMRPIKNHVEMKFDNLAALSEKISHISYYPALFEEAFGSQKIDSTRIKQALAEFLKNFNFSNNKFNRSRANTDKLSPSEEIGRTLFFGKATCFKCHHIEGGNIPVSGNQSPGYGFTDMAFNIGLDFYSDDKGLYEISGRREDEGVFMIPALLNVEYTAPYMHDGRFNTLEEVVEHYNSGIKNHPNLDFRLRDLEKFENLNEQEVFELLDTNHNGDIEMAELVNVPPVKLGLTDSEKRCLVAFLKTLSDPSILTERKFSNPFVSK